MRLRPRARRARHARGGRRGRRPIRLLMWLCSNPASVRCVVFEIRLRINSANAVFCPDVLVHCTQSTNPLTTVELTAARLVIKALLPRFFSGAVPVCDDED